MGDLLYSFHNVIGITGVFFVLIAYFLMQLGRIRHDGIFFSGINSLGSSLILVSLYFDRNLASIVIEISWLLISLFGTVMAFIRVKKTVHSD